MTRPQAVARERDTSAWKLSWLSASIGVATIGLDIIWPLVPQYVAAMGANGIEPGN